MKPRLSLKLVSMFVGMSLCMSGGHAQAGPDAQNQGPTLSKKPLVKVSRRSLYDNSHIIAFRGTHTIVPKNSILFLPSALKGHILDKPDGKFVLWPKFQRDNQPWIWSFEVTLDQAKGLEPLSDQKVKDLERLNRIVIAHYRGNPISVLPLKIKTAER